MPPSVSVSVSVSVSLCLSVVVEEEEEEEEDEGIERRDTGCAWWGCEFSPPVMSHAWVRSQVLVGGVNYH